MNHKKNPLNNFTSADLSYQQNSLCFSQVSLEALARTHHTPLFVYSLDQINTNVLNYKEAFAGMKSRICYAVKANSSLAILRFLTLHDIGFDIVSGGELSQVLAVGADPANIVYSGVGKTVSEIDFALHQSIGCFNIESLQELYCINQRAKALNVYARVSLRINPEVSLKTHKYIATGKRENKFGISLRDAQSLLEKSASNDASLTNIKIVGVGAHIGSQIISVSPYRSSFAALCKLAIQAISLQLPIEHIDVGGGLGIRYNNEKIITPKVLAQELFAQLKSVKNAKTLSNITLILEPGRSLIGNCGVLLTKVLYTKQKINKREGFAIVDAGMNDLIRPALYQGYHHTMPVLYKNAIKKTWDIVGPVCESGDFLSLQQRLALAPDDIIALLNVGAYGMSMSSNYNTRLRAKEVAIYNGATSIIREREVISDLLKHDHWQHISI
ncbi:MAG: diaminopimelate decarboxylase [Methylacidiphilales bacterium]|nr:diaminopimelate decarboxylase [Candidatus Methylacidiphilales bacterium]